MNAGKSEKREAKRFRKQHGMRITGKSCFLLLQLSAKERKPKKSKRKNRR